MQINLSEVRVVGQSDGLPTGPVLPLHVIEPWRLAERLRARYGERTRLLGHALLLLWIVDERVDRSEQLVYVLLCIPTYLLKIGTEFFCMHTTA